MTYFHGYVQVSLCKWTITYTILFLLNNHSGMFPLSEFPVRYLQDNFVRSTFKEGAQWKAMYSSVYAEHHILHVIYPSHGGKRSWYLPTQFIKAQVPAQTMLIIKDVNNRKISTYLHCHLLQMLKSFPCANVRRDASTDGTVPQYPTFEQFCII